MDDDVAESLATANRFAGLARKNDATDFEVVIHTAYYCMYHAARAVLLGAHGSASTNHGRVVSGFATVAARRNRAFGVQMGRALQAAYNLRMIADYGRGGRDLSDEAANLRRQMEDFLDFCSSTASA